MINGKYSVCVCVCTCVCVCVCVRACVWVRVACICLSDKTLFTLEQGTTTKDSMPVRGL